MIKLASLRSTCWPFCSSYRTNDNPSLAASAYAYSSLLATSGCVTLDSVDGCIISNSVGGKVTVDSICGTVTLDSVDLTMSNSGALTSVVTSFYYPFCSSCTLTSSSVSKAIPSALATSSALASSRSWFPPQWSSLGDYNVELLVYNLKVGIGSSSPFYKVTEIPLKMEDYSSYLF